jgi:hypothetical protein
MLPLIHTIVIALHVLFAAAWFGMAAAVPSLARSAMRPGAAEGGKVIASMNGAIVLFYVFAIANWVLGRRLGFEIQYNHWAYHTSLTLGLLLVLVQLFLIRSGWNKLVAGAGTPEAESGRKRLAAGLGVGNLLWIALFILMYVGRGVIGG